MLYELFMDMAEHDGSLSVLARGRGFCVRIGVRQNLVSKPSPYQWLVALLRSASF